MTVIAIGILLTLWNPVEDGPAESCLDAEPLRRQDAGWERSLLEGDTEFLGRSLADDFVWVHDHASAVDSKESLLGWVSTDESRMISRTQSEVETRRLGGTGIVMGYTVVSRPGGSTRYRFMRTYVESKGECLLLANQTMVIPDEG